MVAELCRLRACRLKPTAALRTSLRLTGHEGSEEEGGKVSSWTIDYLVYGHHCEGDVGGLGSVPLASECFSE